ncbi:MAG: hypothetical protein ACE5JA_10075, partial [bacterium]
MRAVGVFGVMFSMAFLFCLPAFADVYTGADGPPYVADPRVVKNVTFERIQALERRADILDGMGKVE